MGKLNKFIILLIVAFALVALAGTASAAVTFTVDKIQTNGHYVGVPTLLGDEIYHWGYEYTLVPDGTYTVFGHVTNTNYREERVGVDIGYHENVAPYFKDFYVSAEQGIKPGVANFAITCPASKAEDVKVWVTIWTDGDLSKRFMPFDLSGVDYVDAPQFEHTVDQGPMSDSVAIYSNGKLTYNGKPQYSISLY